MRKSPTFLAVAAAFLALSGTQAALLTSYTDSFSSTASFANYGTRGGTWSISGSGTLLNNSTGNSLLYLNLGTLPTAVDFANGYSWTASVDYYVSALAPTTFGLMYNYTTTNATANFYDARFRGNNTNGTSAQIQNHARNASGTEIFGTPTAIGSFTASLSSWYTMTVTATVAYQYVYSFKDSLGTVVSSGTFTQSGSLQLDGGYIGFYSDNGNNGQPYEWDNFSVTVVPEPATIGLILGSAGFVGLVLRSRRNRRH